MNKYECRICGKSHNIFRVIECPEPDLLTELSEDEKRKRVEKIDGFYLLDQNTLFGNGMLLIDMEGLDEPIFYWKVWVSMSPREFYDNLEQIITYESTELNGKLESEIPFYEKSKGLQVGIKFVTTDEIQLNIRIKENSQIKQDQSKPISKERFEEIMGNINHPELFRNIAEFEIPFLKRLTKELDHIQSDYIKAERYFVTNIMSSRSVILQIISNQMLHKKSNKISGFGIHLSFDESFEESAEELKNFKIQGFDKDFLFSNIDEVPIYQIDLGLDIERIKTMIVKLVENVFEENIERLELETFEP